VVQQLVKPFEELLLALLKEMLK